MSEEYGSDYTAYQTNRSVLRKWVRRLFLNSAARALTGPTLDFGCGVGELLSRLPKGSKGLEYNRVSVDLCRQKGLDVEWYDGYADNWCLRVLPERSHFQSMVVSHVLEHLDDPMDVLCALLRSAKRVGIERVLVIVPGPAGYRSDATHRTFVDLDMLRNTMAADDRWGIAKYNYFPLDTLRLGDWFRYHELQVLLVSNS
ncbi:class I SAM-dependent methyltransferase [Rhodanobacter umsongensis]